jgi:hypothetical protein
LCTVPSHRNILRSRKKFCGGNRLIEFTFLIDNNLVQPV